MVAEPNFFKVNRRLLDSERWLRTKFTEGQAWVDLCGLAQYRDSYVKIRGIKVDIKRGQLAYSQLTLSKRWKWSRDRIRRFLNKLELDGDIRQQNSLVTTIITISKYDIWQGTEPDIKTTNKTTSKTDTRIDTKDKNNNINTINTINTEIPSNEIVKIIDAFKLVNPSYGKFFANKTQRAASERLLKQFQLEEVLHMIETAAKSNGQQYAPVITSPLELEDKLGKLIAFMKKETSSAPVFVDLTKKDGKSLLKGQ